jgi:hypothetical protein
MVLTEMAMARLGNVATVRVRPARQSLPGCRIRFYTSIRYRRMMVGNGIHRKSGIHPLSLAVSR